MTSANEKQVAGTHYKSAYQHWDWTNDIGLPYLPSACTKYLTRWKKKNGIQDLEKAKHYLDKYIELTAAQAEHIDARTERFLEENKVEFAEQSIFLMIAAYKKGNKQMLISAQVALNNLLDEAKRGV